MSLQLDMGTSRTLSGNVVDGQISGWSLQFLALGPRGATISKTSSNAEQLAILDPVAGTFEVYLSTTDTEVPGTYTVTLRAQDGTGDSYLLLRDTLWVQP